METMESANSASVVSHIDQTALDEIKSIDIDDNTLLKEVVDAYIAQANGIVTRIQGAIESQDYKTLGESIHALKGGSGQVGARILFRQCVEGKALIDKNAAWEQICSHVSLMCHEYSYVKQALVSIVDMEAGNE